MRTKSNKAVNELEIKWNDQALFLPFLHKNKLIRVYLSSTN